MAHETLKTLITDNIKTNGQNAITAQILQDVLIAMVDDYPDISGYATRTWVQQQDYAPKEWVLQQRYVTESALNDYLPLTGGTMTGGIESGSLDTGYYFLSNELMKFEYSYNGSPQYAVGIDINVKNRTITWYGRGGQSTGTEITGNSVTSGRFIVQNGTSAQFLKADGSVDNNSYLSIVNGIVSVSSGDMDIYSAGQHGGMATVFEAKVSQDVIFTGSPYYLLDGDVHASAFIKNGGTENQVLCADGSVKTLSELKAALDAL